MALQFYDVRIDDFREPTQADVDAWIETASAYGKLRQAMEQAHHDLLERLATIRSEHGLPR